MLSDDADERAALLVCRLVVRMRVSPSPEAAAAFAARGERPAADRLAAAVRAARGTGDTGLRRFAADCPTPGVDRAVALVESAAEAPPEERERALDRAGEAVLDGLREAASEAAADLRGPATALYAFGVLLPLALVAVLPAARVAGLPIGLATVVVVYDLLLPAGLCWAAVELLDCRPAACPTVPVSRSHPDVPDVPWHALLAALGAGIAGWTVAGLVLPAWTAPIAAGGGAVGAALAVAARPYVAVREAVRDREAGLPDALSLVGSRVAEGDSVEDALATVAEDLGGGTGETLDRAVDRQRRLGIGVEGSFTGDAGVLASLPSTRLRDAARLFAVAAEEGRPAGAALVRFGEYVAALREVEREAQRDLRRVTATLSNTAAVFGPLVGGATVALADAMVRDGSAIPTPELGLAVGAYVLVLAALLAGLAAGLERGSDPAEICHRAGIAVLSATATYLSAFAATGLLT